MLKRILGGIALILACQLAFAAEVASRSASAPPRIGIVLGGGGARGFAHLGVLMELERLHVPISCISGTSAGALVGGMYANGMSLEGMREAFRTADWDRMLSGRVDRRDTPYDRKRNDYINYFDLTLGVGNGALKVPRSAINSQDIDLFIRKLTRDSTIDSFDKLPIPFRAVATDLSTGEAVVFDKGDLSVALRASMAVPGLFDLVEYDDKLLVDGGVARNLPIQEIKHRCADRVIVVDVGTPPLKKDQINSLFDVVSQTSRLLISRNVSEQMKRLDKDDIVIRPDLDGFSSADFGENQAIMERGLKAAKAIEAKLRALSVPEPEYLAWHETLVAPAAPVINEIRIAGKAGFVNRSAVEARLRQHGNGEDVAEVRKTLRSLFAEGDYDRLTYTISHQNGQNIMSVMPVERATGPDYLRFGMELKGTAPGDSSYNIMASHLRTWVNSAGASWRNEATLGNDPLLRTEFYQPFSATNPMFVAAYASYSEKHYGFYFPSHVKAMEIGIRERTAGLDGGIALGKFGEFRLGAYFSRYHPFHREGIDESFPDNFVPWQDRGIRSQLVIDQFDNPRWPRRGYFFNGEVRMAVPAWGNYNGRYYNVTAENVVTFGELSLRMTGKLRGNILDSAGKRAIQPQFLGGFLNLTGYQQNELVGERVALGRLMGYWRVATLPSALGSGLYTGVSLEAGKVWQPLGLWPYGRDSRVLKAGALFLGADTWIGPVFLGVGAAQGGRLTGYFMVGVDY
ncbi:patatin-like phospholipase family protein [Paludibacterium paludis]|uniref:PNPLA domain-containing protein n=1 Tax=Paludibacterium paludis TaxID=1225769 RepID=A0A918UA58_9NEIS|nr:patatin-like phospholipase family protein [Paludibacterium paludis]GGY17370.1 hypothetical protein GCM10011289_20980 [Paludibacterium paludis]